MPETVICGWAKLLTVYIDFLKVFVNRRAVCLFGFCKRVGFAGRGKGQCANAGWLKITRFCNYLGSC